jgi:type IV pilus assembly protein PilB
MPETRNKRFLEFVRKTPNFGFADELKELAERHGPDTPALLQAIIDSKLVSKDEACRQWGNALGYAYVDPFASIVTEEAVERLPQEVAQKTSSIGLYIIEGVLTVALATPEDETLIKRLSQIAKMPISPVFASEREIQDAISIHY